MGMKMKPKLQRPSFFKVLINMDFTRKLRIPVAFSGKYEESLRGGNVTLRIISCGGKTWDVKVEKTADEDIIGNNNKKYYKFTGEGEGEGGWNRFAKDVGLEIGEFLVFWLDDDPAAKSKSAMFDVSIYGVTGCEKEIININKFQQQLDDDEDEHSINHINACNSSCFRRSPLYLEIVLKKHQKSRLTLTKKFYTASGLMGKESVVLVYLPKRRYQTVVLDRRPDGYRVDMAAGWPEFRKSNRLAIGKTYSFEFKPRKNVIQVQELNNKTLI